MIAGLVLAGGRSSRMGGDDKALIELAGKSLLSHSIANLAPQATPLAISSNNDLGSAAGGFPVLPDLVEGRQGPLAGIHAGLVWAKSLAGVECLVTVSVDAPFIPAGFVSQLTRRAEETEAPIVVASSSGNHHPTCALWRVSLLTRLETFLRESRSRRAMHFVSTCGFVTEDFISGLGADPFFNVNTPDDLAAARRWLGEAS